MKSLQYSQTDPPTLFLFSAAPEFPAVSLLFHSIFSGHFAGLQDNSAHAEAVPDPFSDWILPLFAVQCILCGVSSLPVPQRILLHTVSACFPRRAALFRSDQQGSFCCPSLRNPYPLQNPFSPQKPFSLQKLLFLQNLALFLLLKFLYSAVLPALSVFLPPGQDLPAPRRLPVSAFPVFPADWSVFFPVPHILPDALSAYFLLPGAALLSFLPSGGTGSLTFEEIFVFHLISYPFHFFWHTGLIS